MIPAVTVVKGTVGTPTGNGQRAAPEEDPTRPFLGIFRRTLPSLRLLITLIVVLPIAIVAAALVTISIVTSRTVAEQLGEELDPGRDRQRRRRGATLHRRRRPRQRPVHAADRDGEAVATNLAEWEQVMFDDLATNPDVASICFGNPRRGRRLAPARARPDRVRHRRRREGLRRRSSGSSDPTGSVQRDKVIRQYKYDPRTRPWYKAALHNPTPAWTTSTSGSARAGASRRPASATRAWSASGHDNVARRADGRRDAQRDQPLSPPPAVQREPATIFIVDDQGLLVASSAGRVTSDKGQRLTPEQASSSAISRQPKCCRRPPPTLTPSSRSPIATTAPSHPGKSASRRPKALASGRVLVDGQPARTTVTPLNPFPGLRWRIVTVLPESSFLARGRTRRTGRSSSRPERWSARSCSDCSSHADSPGRC